MLAICRNAQLLRSHAYHYFPLDSLQPSRNSIQHLEVEYSEAIQCFIPVFQGPHKKQTLGH